MLYVGRVGMLVMCGTERLVEREEKVEGGWLWECC